MKTVSWSILLLSVTSVASAVAGFVAGRSHEAEPVKVYTVVIRADPELAQGGTALNGSPSISPAWEYDFRSDGDARAALDEVLDVMYRHSNRAMGVTP